MQSYDLKSCILTPLNHHFCFLDLKVGFEILIVKYMQYGVLTPNF